MPIDTKKMSQETGIPERLLEKYLGIRIRLTNYKLALNAYKNAVTLNSVSTISRKTEVEILIEFCNSFSKAYSAFKASPKESPENKLFFILMTQMVANKKDALRLCNVLPLEHPYEKSAICAVAKYFLKREGAQNSIDTLPCKAVQKMQELCLEKYEIPYKSFSETLADMCIKKSK